MNIRPPLQSLSIIIILIISSVLVRDTDSIPLPFSDDLNLRTFEQASSSPPGGGGGGDGGRLTEVEDPSSSIPSSSQFDASSTSNQIRSNDVEGFDSTFIVPGTDPLAIGSPNSPGGSPQDPSSPVSSPVSSPDISASPQQEGNTNSNSPAAISALDLPPTQDDTAPTRSNSPKSNNNVQSPVAAALDSEAAAVQTTSVVSASSASASSSSFQSGDGGKAPNQISSQQYTADVSFLDAAVSASDAAVFVSETAVQQTVVASTTTEGGGGGGVQQSSSSNNGVPVDVVQPDNMESQRSEAAIVRQSFESESSQANQAIVSDAGNDLPNGAMPPDSAVRSSTREMAREAEAAAAADQTDANVEIRQEDTDRPVQEVRSQEKEMTMTYREESYTERPVLIVRSQEKEMLTYKDMKESGEVESSSPSSSSDDNPGQRSFKEEINSAYAEGPTFKEEGGASAATTGDDDSIKATEDKLQAEADNESSNDSKIGDDTNIENELPSGAIPPESAVESIVDAKLDNDKEDAAAAAPGSNSLQAERTAPAIVIAATEHEESSFKASSKSSKGNEQTNFATRSSKKMAVATVSSSGDGGGGNGGRGGNGGGGGSNGGGGGGASEAESTLAESDAHNGRASSAVKVSPMSVKAVSIADKNGNANSVALLATDGGGQEEAESIIAESGKAQAEALSDFSQPSSNTNLFT